MVVKIILSQIYNNQPYYTIRCDDGEIKYVFGVEQAEKIIKEAKERNEKIELEDKILEEHNKLKNLLISLARIKINLKKAKNDEKTK